jgi:CRISPR-associated endonuclease Csy4
MDHYVDIELLPDPELSQPVIMSALFAKIHGALVALKSKHIGISFPKLQSLKNGGLGDCLRIHGNIDDLQLLMPWLTMFDYAVVRQISQIPAQTNYCSVRRVQVDSNPERLQRRLMKRKNVSEAEARQLISGDAVKLLDLPFVTVKSRSTGQMFRLFIEQKQLDSPKAGGFKGFNGYGLSQTATLPFFDGISVS